MPKKHNTNGKKEKLMPLKSKLMQVLPILSIVIVAVVGYCNSLNGDFLVIDDKDLIVENEQIKDLGKAVGSFEISGIIHALLYSAFGLNPVPFHIVSLTIHILNVILAYFLIKKLFDEKIAFITGLLFSVHPLTTEAVSWISGKSHLLTTFFGLLIIHSYIKFREDNPKDIPWPTLLLFLVTAYIHRSMWVIVIPLAVIVIDWFFLKIKSKNTLVPAIFAIAAVFLLLTQSKIYDPHNRIPDQFNRKKGAIGVLRNQEELLPVIEGWPYTIFSGVKLYALPINLMIYYDGNPVSTATKVLMYAVSGFYIYGIWYFIQNKKRKVAGLLIMPLVLVAPALSPLKVTWYVAERYFYFGSIFFSALLALGLQYGVEKLKIKRILPVILAVILVLYMTRTIIRNKDWQSTKALAQATIKTSPQGIRGYNDLGNAYYFENDFEKALEYYNIALQFDIYSDTSIKNIGLILLENGPEYLEIQNSLSKVSYDKEKLPLISLAFFQNNDNLKALYFAGEYLKIEENNPNALEIIGEVYIRGQKWEYAEKVYNRVLENYPDREKSYLNLGFIKFQTEQYDKALEYLEKAQEINPSNQNTNSYIEMVHEKLSSE